MKIYASQRLKAQGFAVVSAMSSEDAAKFVDVHFKKKGISTYVNDPARGFDFTVTVESDDGRDFQLNFKKDKGGFFLQFEPNPDFIISFPSFKGDIKTQLSGYLVKLKAASQQKMMEDLDEREEEEFDYAIKFTHKFYDALKELLVYFK